MAHQSITTKPFWPDRAWWLTLLFVLLCAGALRYTGYDFGLPYIEKPEEARLNILARDIVATGEIAPEDTHAPYPLGLIGIHYVLLSWFHSPDALPSTILPAVRIISITISLASIVLIALLGYRVSTPLAGLAASILWAVMSDAVQISRTGTADTFVTFCLLLALFLTLSGTLYYRNGWVLWGCVALMFAALFAYQAVLLVPLLLLIPLDRMRNAIYEERRTILRNLSDQVFLFTLFLIWLLWLSPLIVSIKMGQWDTAFGSLTLSVLIQNIRIPVAESIQSIAWVSGLVGWVWLLWSRLWRKTWTFGLVAIAVFGIVWGIVVGAEYTQDFEHLMLISALLAVVCGVGLAGWGEAIGWVIEHVARPRPKSEAGFSRVGNIGMVVLVTFGSVPSIRGAIHDAYQHRLPDRRNALAVWADTTLEGANFIADSSNDRILNAVFGGYRGLSMFPMVETALVTDRPLEEWRSREVMYAIIPYDTYQDMQTSTTGQVYLDRMVVLKAYPSSQNYRDAGMVVFRLYPIQHPVDADLGSIHLVGYDIDRTEVTSGERLTIRYYWQAVQPTKTLNRVFNHLYPLDAAEPVAQIDGPPLADLRRPTTSWNDPTETIISQSFALAIGPDVAPGEYRLVIGFYDPDTGQRLLTPNGESFVLVTIIQVTSR